MSWNRAKAIERIKTTERSIPDIEVSALTREMDLENVTLGKPKRITGVHLYSAVTNEAAHVTDHINTEDQDGVRGPTRSVHLWQREARRIVCDDFESALIHFQGTRLHALTYRPVADDIEIACRAIALAHALRITMNSAFNEVLKSDAGFSLAAGAAYGSVLATRSGSPGDSELLFIGDAANQGAKALAKATSLRVTNETADLLHDALSATMTETDDGFIRVGMTQSAVEAAVDRYQLGWSLDTSVKRIRDDLATTPLSKVGISKATGKIDKDRLSLSNSKLNDGVSLFGDIDGFTAVVEAATTQQDQERLVRHFHVARSELRHVATQDFGTLRVQYQGDRTQVLDHLPHDDEADRALHAVRLAGAWQSTMEDSLPAVTGNLDDIHLAIGIDAGSTVISKLGRRGNRDMICLGRAVRLAARIQEALDGDEVGISRVVYGLLPRRVAELFDWDAGKQCHLVKGLRYNDIVLAEEAAGMDQSASATIPNLGGLAGATAVPPRRWHR